MKPYEFVIVKNPTEEARKTGEAATIIAHSSEPFLAPDDQAAAMIAGRKIPDDQMPFIDRLRVFVRPF